MAKYINPVAKGTAIGKGEAQVIDSAGLMKWAIDRKDKVKEQERKDAEAARKAAKEDREKKEKNLLDSLVDIDSSKVYKRDIPMYNEKWENYRNYIKENHEALMNPAQNVDVFHEKKRMENELLQFVGSSNAAQKMDVEMQKFKLTDGFKDIEEKEEGQYESWLNTPGNMDNPFSYYQRITPALADELDTFMKDIPTDIDIETTDAEGGKITQKGTSPEKFEEHANSEYDNNSAIQASATKAWEDAGGAEESGFATPKEYFLDVANKRRDAIQEKTTEVKAIALSEHLDDFTTSSIKVTDMNYTTKKDGKKVTKKGTTKKKWNELAIQEYETNPGAQKSANTAWEAAGGAEGSGFATAKDYWLDAANKRRSAVFVGIDEDKDSTIIIGGFNHPSKLNYSSDVIKTTNIVGGENVENDARRIVFTKKEGGEMSSMNVKLQGTVTNEKGEDVTSLYKEGLQGAKIESVVEISTGKYEVHYSVPREEVDYTAKKAALQAERDLLGDAPGLLSYQSTKDEWKNKSEDLNKREVKLLAEEKEDKGKGFTIIRVPIDNVTNIADLETNLGYESGTLIEALPSMFTALAKPSEGSDPLDLF